MSVGSGLHAGEIDCLVLRLKDKVRWLKVFARRARTHWLALYAPLFAGIELFDSFGFSPRMYSLDFLDPLHSSYSLQSPRTSLCGHYCIVYIYLCSHNYSLSDIVHLLTNISSRDLWVKQYIYNMQIRLCILNPCHSTGQRCKFC